MKRIVFVCHGNICRSPMAEFIFKHIIKDSPQLCGLDVASRATSEEEIYNGVGSPIYPPAKEELRKNGIAFEDRRAAKLASEDAFEYDMFIGMDENNIRNMKRILGEGAEGKIFKLKDFSHKGGDVSDPWYTGRFDIAYSDIYEGCLGLKAFLSSGNTDN